MKISVLCVGKIREPFYRDALEEYEKRLSRYCRLQICQTADEKAPETLSEAEEKLVLKKEGERLEKLLQPDAYVIALCIDGKSMDSPGFAGLIENLGTRGVSHIQFLIGGSLGLDKSLTKRADLRLSFSKLTFPHQLMRVILLEQLYRAFRILHHEPYHK